MSLEEMLGGFMPKKDPRQEAVDSGLKAEAERIKRKNEEDLEELEGIKRTSHERHDQASRILRKDPPSFH
jgi:hypothetical protein